MEEKNRRMGREKWNWEARVTEKKTAVKQGKCRGWRQSGGENRRHSDKENRTEEETGNEVWNFILNLGLE